jgi:hypothetical protein
MIHDLPSDILVNAAVWRFTSSSEHSLKNFDVDITNDTCSTAKLTIRACLGVDKAVSQLDARTGTPVQ